MTNPTPPITNDNGRILGLVVGFIFIAFGFGNAWLTARMPVHSDKELMWSMAMAVLGAGLVSPTLMASALKSVLENCKSILPKRDD